jgi:hypothetical protein
MWTVEAIGDTAGRVWQFLHQKGASTLTAVEQGVTAPRPMVHMAIGWLAREGKIGLQQETRSLKLHLTE